MAAPIIVVEVLSPSTKHVDTSKKLEGDFRIPSVQHYLVVGPDRPLVIHHRRGTGDLIETRILASGTLSLNPPGQTLPVADLFPPP